MHKIIQINLAGQAIPIDEVAYEKLRSYLDAVQKHFSNTASGNEIFEDIEARIAEMFLQKIKGGRTFIDMDVVTETIGIMGNPDEMTKEQEEEEASYQSDSGPSSTSSKKLFRDGDDKILGGVASGLAAYFDLDVSLVRLAFIIGFIFFGVGIVPYILLWLVMPEAKTPQDRARMRGEAPDINTIARNIRKEAENVADHLKKNSSVQAGIKGISKLVSDIFEALGKIAGSFVLIGLVIAGVSILTFLIFSITGKAIAFSSSILHIPQLFESNTISIIFVISLLFVVLIPLASLAYFLICFIFDIQGMRYNTKSMFAVWLICLAAMVGTGIYGVQHMKFEQLEEFRVEKQDGNTI